MLCAAQAILLTSRGSPWSVCWFDVEALPLMIPRTGSGINVSGLIAGTSPTAASTPTNKLLPPPPAEEDDAKRGSANAAEKEVIAVGSGVDIA